MNFEPIGFLQSCYPEKFGTPRQPGLVGTSWAQLRIERRWQPEQALIGIERFSHVWLVFVFHRNENLRYHAKVHPPRLEGEKLGVFATRSPHRPNPIGLSLVKLEKLKEGILTFSGVDLIDGTPILDIKPYLPEVEAIPGASSGWTSDVEPASRRLEWAPAALERFYLWTRRRQQQPQGKSDLPPESLKSMIEQTLCLDPRPVVYRGYEGSDEGRYRQNHAVRFFDCDVHFRFLSEDFILIEEFLF